MTPTQQNIAIAKVRGWVDIHKLDNGVSYGWHPTKHPQNQFKYEAPLPLYTTDLNACAEMERTLTEDQHDAFRRELWEVIASQKQYPTERDFVSATAPQRAEAFLRTLGLFEEVEG